MSNRNFDTVEWSEEAQRIREIINERLTSPMYEELVKQSQDAWDEWRNTSTMSERSKLLDIARYLTDAINAYKDETAVYAAQLSKLRPLDVYTEDTIGKLRLRGNYSGDNSVPEWLAGRKNGFGGSDIGNALDVTTGKYAKSSGDVLIEKATLELDFQSTVENIKTKVNNFSGPLGRGNAWETVIAQMFQREHAEDFKVLEAKATYHNPEHAWQTVNVDGLLCSDGVNPDGILEIKTSSRPWDGEVPIGYRAQVLNYLYATGFTYAYIAVLINDLYYEEYFIHSDDTISGNPYREGSLADIDFYDAAIELDKLWVDVIKERKRRYGNNWQSVLDNAPHEFYVEAREAERRGKLDKGIVVYPAYFAQDDEGDETVVRARGQRNTRLARGSNAPREVKNRRSARRSALDELSSRYD